MRVAVTGGSGKIGTPLVKALAGRGHAVINLDRRAPREPIDGVRHLPVDVTDRAQVRPALEQVDAVCHLGEIPNAHVADRREEIYAHNTRAGAVVLQTAADLKLSRAIYTSSCQVYGMWDEPRVPPRHLPFDETHPLQPQNVYALGKAANEAYARLLGEQAGLSVAAFRFPWVLLDPYDAKWARWLLDPPHTDGLATCVHVTDAVKAYVLALEHPRPGFEPYHFSMPEVLSLQPLAERLAKHHPEYPKLPDGWPPFRSPVLTDKAREHFGWTAGWNFLDFHRAGEG